MSADGTWKTTINSPMGVQQGTLTVKTDGATFTGTMAGAQGSQEVSGKVDGNTLTWGSKLTQPFPIDLEFTVSVDGDAMTGSVKAGAFGSMPVKGERVGASATTLLAAWKAATARLAQAGVESPTIDARLLLEAAAPVARAEILADPHRALAEDAAERLEAFVARRERREPISHILGRKGFWTLMLDVGPTVLTPRPDTETLLDVVLAGFPPGRAFSVLDLGVGSGAILLAILAERPLARGLGVDVSEDALAVARDNAAQLGLAGRAALLRGDWTFGLADASFDLVVANPPYIPSAEIATLEPEVRDHEPRLALDGGADGLAAYRVLAPELLRVLKAGGAFAAEIGIGQRPDVEALFAAAGAEAITAHRDLAGRERVVAGCKKPLGK